MFLCVRERKRDTEKERERKRRERERKRERIWVFAHECRTHRVQRRISGPLGIEGTGGCEPPDNHQTMVLYNSSIGS